MEKIKQAIIDLAHDTENADKNYKLGLLYEKIGQTASAITYFFRAAERTESSLLSYECLLRTSNCYERQGNRANTVKRVLQHAICLLPRRPEAYFLLARIQERTKQYVDGYQTATQALNICQTLNHIDGVEYPGSWGLKFEKAVCAWWWGRNMESRELFLKLAHQHRDGIIKLDDIHYNAVQNNLCNIGCGPVSIAYKQYDKSKYNRFKFKFPGFDEIQRNFSQVYQDLFVLAMLNGKRNGTYYEIGGGDPFHGNNTALLEDFGWKGISFDYNRELVDRYNKVRKNRCLEKNALDLDHDSYLKNIAIDGVVDYLQLDCEPSKNTYTILTQIPFEKYKFNVITYEHDHYVDMTGLYRGRSRRFLRSMGYELVVNDISPDGKSTFEDWWIHPDYIDNATKYITSTLGSYKMKKYEEGYGSITNIEEYFLS